MKTLSQLKRDAQSGNLVLEMVERYGETGDKIPERLRGKRKLVGANSACIIFLNANGDKSECRIPRAALVDYDDDMLIVYGYGERPMTQEEQAVLDEWNAIANTPEYKEQSRIDALSDGSSSFYQKLYFFEKKGFPWLTGWEDISKYGKSYNMNTGLVRDVNVRGEAELKYRICR